MHAACNLCRGACCESLVIDLPAGPVGDWLAAHGAAIAGPAVELPTPCRHLCASGTCTIWQNRPTPCVDYAVGSPACRATVLRRRPARAAEILALLP
jgi:hypothetical protein